MMGSKKSLVKKLMLQMNIANSKEKENAREEGRRIKIKERAMFNNKLDLCFDE